MKVFRSRVGWEIWGPVVVLFGAILYKSGVAWPVLVFLLFLSWFMVMMIIGTRYIISDNNLVVKCWPVINIEIDIDSIHRIRKTWNPISSPAASYIGRIEVHYDKGKSCIISPKDKSGFIAALLSKNKSILTFEVD